MQSFNLDKLSVVIPVKNEDHEIIRSIKNELELHNCEVIVVDDGSVVPFEDSIKHEVNKGYGAALMTGIDAATRPYILMMDGDGQHTPAQAIKLYFAFLLAEVDMMIGARRLKEDKLIRVFGRKFLNFIASLFAWRFLSDLNSGMRVFKKETVSWYFPILCKKFSFTTSLTMAMLCDNYIVEWFPIKIQPRAHGKSHVNVIKDGLITFWYIVKIGGALRTRRLRAWLRRLRGMDS